MAKKASKLSRPRLERLILKEHKRNPYLGVRKLARLLADKHKIRLSKSLVHKLLSSKGLEEQPGRKKEILKYKKQELEDCGALLLRALEGSLGLFEAAADGLLPYFPKASLTSLKKVIMLVSFYSFFGQDKEAAASSSGLLRAAQLYVFPGRKIADFLDKIAKVKPVVDLEPLQYELQPCSTAKFSFNNGTSGFCDAGFSTFWDKPCYISSFFLPLRQARARLAAMLAQRTVMVNYTKSFDYLSPLTINFINGLSSGVAKIEFLDAQGQAREELVPPLGRLSFLIGYYPRILSQGLVFLDKGHRFRKIDHPWGELFYSSGAVRFLQPEENKGVILNSLLLKRNRRFLPCWGLLTNKKTDPKPLLKKHLTLWPYMDKVFLEEMEVIEKFYTTEVKTKPVRGFLPRQVTLAQEADFAQISEILALIFKEKIGKIELKDKKGRIVTNKEFLLLRLERVPLSIKREFNKAGLYIANKRAVLV